MRSVRYRLPGVRDQLGKLGASLMILGAGAALAYLITAKTQGPPSPHQAWPPWPYYLCGAMLLIGAFLYGEAHGVLPWQKYHALKRRAEAAESALAGPYSLPMSSIGGRASASRAWSSNCR